jgi:3-oxoacyl-[acyl-carrier protein] reductase
VQATGPPIPLCPLSEVKDDQFRTIIETDVIGAFNIVKRGIPVLKRDKYEGKSLLLLLTAAVCRTVDHDGMSYIPKMAVQGIMRQAAREAGRDGIRLNGIAPGVFDAGIVRESFTVDEMSKSVIDDCCGNTPLSRMGKLYEMAETAAFLISDKAGYINGQVIAVDGGFSA